MEITLEDKMGVGDQYGKPERVTWNLFFFSEK